MPYGDFSLDPFAERPNTARVLMQQGRVMLDSDWNAQVAASTSMLRKLAVSLLGPWAAANPNAFKIEGSGNALTIEAGTYWVNGIPVVNEQKVDVDKQPAFKDLDTLQLSLAAPVLLYLDVWEHSVSSHEDDSLREVALGGPDTTLRSEIRWAVRAVPLNADEIEKFTKTTSGTQAARAAAKKVLEEEFLPTFFTRFASNATLTAEATPHDTTDACLVAPDARYRGVENQLYRVEVYRGTHDAFGNPIGTASGPLPPLLVWSRDNGSVTLPVDTVDGQSIEVTSLGRDDRTRLKTGANVQFVDRYDAATGVPRPINKVTEVSDYRSLVTLRDAVEPPEAEPPAILRRWDGGPREISLANNEMEIDLENDIVVTLRVEPTTPPTPLRLRTGDYWIIPARTLTGDVIWPKEANGDLKQLPPQGVAHHFAPLAAVPGGTAPLIDVRTLIQKPVAMV